MAPRNRIGAIIRRGAATIDPATMRILVENEDKVQEIINDIDTRAASFRELEASTNAGSVALEKAQGELVERETALAEGLAKLEADRDAAAAATLTFANRRAPLQPPPRGQHLSTGAGLLDGFRNCSFL